MLEIVNVKAQNISARTILVANTDSAGEILVSLASAKGIVREDKSIINIVFEVGSNVPEERLVKSVVLRDAVLFDCTGIPVPVIVENAMHTEGSESVPVNYSLLQNYPNPFNSSTTISFQLPIDGDVSLKVYNTSGQLVRTLVDGYQSAGHVEAHWDGKNDSGKEVASGIYFYQLSVGNFVSMKKMSFLQ